MNLSTRRIDVDPLQIYLAREITPFVDVWPSVSNQQSTKCFPFQAAEFLQTWNRTVGLARRAESFYIAVFNSAQKPVLLLPIAIERRHGLRWLTFMDGGLSDYNAPILFGSDVDQELFAKLWKGILSMLPKIDIVDLQKMPALIFGIHNPMLGLSTHLFGASGHAAALSGDWSNFACRLSWQQDSRRQFKRLSEIGHVEFRIAEDLAESRSFLEKMIEQKTRRYVETRGSDGFARPGYKQFFSDFTERFDDGLLHVSALLVGGTIIAAHWGYVWQNVFYYMMPSFEGGPWRRYSGGRLLCDKLIQWGLESNLQSFDFGVGDEAYKRPYCDTALQLSSALCATSYRGKAFLVARHMAKRVLETAKNWKRAFHQHGIAGPQP